MDLGPTPHAAPQKDTPRDSALHLLHVTWSPMWCNSSFWAWPFSLELTQWE